MDKQLEAKIHHLNKMKISLLAVLTEESDTKELIHKLNNIDKQIRKLQLKQ